MGGININPKNPTQEVVGASLPASGYTGTLLMHHINILIPFNATSTASANMVWLNPEPATVLAKPSWVWRTAGTGTFSAGVTSDGTGSANDIITAGTLLRGVIVRATTGSALLGTAGEAGGYFLIGPGGTGTSNSISATVTDTTTSTAVGGMVVSYCRVL